MRPVPPTGHVPLQDCRLAPTAPDASTPRIVPCGSALNLAGPLEIRGNQQESEFVVVVVVVILDMVRMQRVVRGKEKVSQPHRNMIAAQ